MIQSPSIKANSALKVPTLTGNASINTTGSGTTTIGNSTGTTTLTSVEANTVSIGNLSITSTASGNYTLNLPTGVQSSATTLSNDGSGNLSWASHGNAASLTIAGYCYNATNSSGSSNLNMFNQPFSTQNFAPSTANGTSTPYTSYVVPIAGNYSILLKTWACGVGNNETRVTVTRSGSTYFNHLLQYEGLANCGIASTPAFLPSLQVGDVITIQASTNANGGGENAWPDVDYSSGDSACPLIIWKES